MLLSKVSLKYKMQIPNCCCFLDVKPGMRVVDTWLVLVGKHCIAALMENKGQLIAMDLYESKLKQLKIK
jgi:16S rRNA (cytosine967-C5)-methyltransferase